jgi:hypothetical protein
MDRKKKGSQDKLANKIPGPIISTCLSPFHVSTSHFHSAFPNFVTPSPELGILTVCFSKVGGRHACEPGKYRIKG